MKSQNWLHNTQIEALKQVQFAECYVLDPTYLVEQTNNQTNANKKKTNNNKHSSFVMLSHHSLAFVRSLARSCVQLRIWFDV